ncbi:hypothetical protein ACMFMF_007602 [Clarireedia jacksonii]
MAERDEPILSRSRVDEEVCQLLPTFMDGNHPADISSDTSYDCELGDDGEAEKHRISTSRSRSSFQTLRKLSLKLAVAFIPSPIQHYLSFREPKAGKSQLAYLDGLRGIAAFIVYVDHFSAPHFKGMLDSYGSTPNDNSILQLPIIRLLYNGGPMVCLFFVISGTVLSLKPLTLQNAQHWMHVYQTLSSSVFRRLIRLYLPTTIVTFLRTPSYLGPDPQDTH